MNVSPRDFRSPLSMAYRWNEERAAKAFSRLKHEKNAFRRSQLERDGNRFTKNAIDIHRRQFG
jgi:hypothetical protein